MHEKSFDLKAFISYSRKDGLEFVEQLVPALEAVGVHPIIDRHGISGGEDWRERINSLIAEADSVVFVITHKSVASEICEWEIDKSDQLGKRIIPVVPAPIDGILLHNRLAKLNHVFFYPEVSVPGAGFGSGLAKLSKVLRADISWVRAHTRYGQRAAEWVAGNRAPNRLFSGSDIEAAKIWMAERQASAPEITDAIREFLDASEQADNERRNIEQKRIKEKEENLNKIAKVQALAQRIILAGIIIFLALALVTGWMWNQAEKSKSTAKGHLDLIGWSGNKNLGGGDRVPTVEQKSSMIELCNDAIEITAKIGSNQKSDNAQQDKDKFWVLYSGALYVVEQFERYYLPEKHNKIESMMVNFGKVLNDEREGNLVDAANGVENACREFEHWLKNKKFD